MFQNFRFIDFHQKISNLCRKPFIECYHLTYPCFCNSGIYWQVIISGVRIFVQILNKLQTGPNGVWQFPFLTYWSFPIFLCDGLICRKNGWFLTLWKDLLFVIVYVITGDYLWYGVCSLSGWSGEPNKIKGLAKLFAKPFFHTHHYTHHSSQISPIFRSNETIHRWLELCSYPYPNRPQCFCLELDWLVW